MPHPISHLPGSVSRKLSLYLQVQDIQTPDIRRVCVTALSPHRLVAATAECLGSLQRTTSISFKLRKKNFGLVCNTSGEKYLSGKDYDADGGIVPCIGKCAHQLLDRQWPESISLLWPINGDLPSRTKM